MWLDIFVLVILVVGIFRGLRNGFVKEVAGLVGIILGIWAGFRLAFVFAEYYKDHFHLPEKTLPVLAFLTAFTIVLVAVFMIGLWLKFLLDKANLSLFDKSAGAFFAAVKAAFVVGVLLSLLGKSGILSPAQQSESYAYKPVTSFSEGVHDYTVGLLPEAKNIFREMDGYFRDLEKKHQEQRDSLTDGAAH